MAINRDKPDLWKADIALSVDLYNDWFMNFAPKAFRDTRVMTTKQVEEALIATKNLTAISPELLIKHPQVLPMLRMSTCPPIARDRLTGLSGVPKSLIDTIEKIQRVPPRMMSETLVSHLTSVVNVITKLADPDIFVWLGRSTNPSKSELHRAATIVADRLCGAIADPIIRNAQERRQLAEIASWLDARGYTLLTTGTGTKFDAMPPGTYSFRMNVPVDLVDGLRKVNIPVDVVIMPKAAQVGDLPLMVEAKSAGDFTNVNKRRKEEAVKMSQLSATYHGKIRFILYLCGYFDSGYLGYEAAEGIDWVWEHRTGDLALFGL